MRSEPLAIAAFTVLAGCGIAAPLQPVRYDGEATVASGRTAELTLETGIVTGSSGTTIEQVGTFEFRPVATGPMPGLFFNVQDQQVFVDSLRSELVRLGIVAAAPVSESPADLSILIVFARTHHDPNTNEYTLDVVMQLENEGAPQGKHYRIVSSEDDTLLDKWTTSAQAGKTRAARMLMAQLIPDIESWVSSNR